MDVRRLLVLAVVLRRGSLSGAARELQISQQAVSQQVRALEREVGAALVVRGPTGTRATDAGRLLWEHADAISAHLRAARAEVAALAGEEAAVVRLTVFPTAAAALVPPALAALATSRPALEVRLTEAEPEAALQLVRTGEADAAVVFRHDDDPAPAGRDVLVHHRLGHDDVKLLLPLGHPLARAARLSLAQLADERWVAGCPRCRGHLERAARRAGFSPDVRHVSDDHLVVQALVAQSLAVALLPTLALGLTRHDGVTVRDVSGLAGRRIEWVHHRDGGRLPGLAALRTALVGAAGR